MKKILSLILCAALCFTLALSLTSCGYDGKLVVATSPDFPPFENLVDGEVVGIEVEIMEKICDELNYELVFEQIIFDSVLPGIEAGKYDCGMSGITVTPERAESVLFTDAYYVAAQAIVVSADSSIESKADLAGKKVSVQLGTTADDFCNKNGYQVSAFESNGDAKLALTEGRVDAWVVDDLTAEQMCAGDESVVILDDKMTEEPYAFAFNFEDEALVEKINEILNKLIEDGTIASIFEKYGEDYVAPAN